MGMDESHILISTATTLIAGTLSAIRQRGVLENTFSLLITQTTKDTFTRDRLDNSPQLWYTTRMNNEQLQLIEAKYGKLIHKIGHWISGDTAISSHEDNTQDIWMAAMEAIRGYEKKENMTFEEFWGSKGFDKYLKTCLWNVKNSKGAKITKKFPITRNTVDIADNEEVLQKTDPTVVSPETELFLEDLPCLLTEEEQGVVSIILQEPSMIKPSGKANVNAIADRMGKTWAEMNTIVQRIARKLENQL